MSRKNIKAQEDCHIANLVRTARIPQQAGQHPERRPGALVEDLSRGPRGLHHSADLSKGQAYHEILVRNPFTEGIYTS
jgi:hypothetical protein